MKSFGISMGMIALVLGLGTGACAEPEETMPAGDDHGEMPMGEHGMHDTGAMERHAQEADSMATVLREHVRQMRDLPAEQWHDRMGEHVGQVSGMLRLMDRHMREMDMGMNMSDEDMGRMMGMTGDQHRRMMEELQALRSELEELQTAPPEDLEDRMPDHLDTLERMATMMEQSAEHMGSM